MYIDRKCLKTYVYLRLLVLHVVLDCIKIHTPICKKYPTAKKQLEETNSVWALGSIVCHGQLGMIGWERAGTSGSGSGRQVESARSGNLPQAAQLADCFEGSSNSVYFHPCS